MNSSPESDYYQTYFILSCSSQRLSISLLDSQSPTLRAEFNYAASFDNIPVKSSTVVLIKTWAAELRQRLRNTENIHWLSSLNHTAVLKCFCDSAPPDFWGQHTLRHPRDPSLRWDRGPVYTGVSGEVVARRHWNETGDTGLWIAR